MTLASSRQHLPEDGERRCRLCAGRSARSQREPRRHRSDGGQARQQSVEARELRLFLHPNRPQPGADRERVKTRQRSVSASGFEVALEEEEASTAPHGSETVGWLAVEPGQRDWNGHAYEADQTPKAVRHNWYGITFAQNFGAAPRFVAAMTTFDGGDSAQLRYDRTSLTANGVQVLVEEDTTDDSETGHTTEVVGYLALEGNGTLRGRALAGTVTKYYYADGKRVARREGGMVYYLHGDHLGSTSLATDAGGAKVSRVLYYPYGTERYSEGTLPTDFGFTGQRRDGSTRLVFMHARYYHARLGRFISADSIVPEPGNPQSFNRYSYVLGNPLRYTDPTGYFESDVELARYLGFGSAEDMYNSDLWARWSQSDEWMAMIRSKEFDFGSVLVWESEDAVLQTMLLECDGKLALWSWGYPFPAELNEYSLNDVFASDRQALFHNPDPTKGLEENYHPVAYSGNGAAALPSPTFHYSGLTEDVWANGSANGYVRVVVERKSDWIVGGLKIAGGTWGAGKGATLMVAGFLGAPETLGGSLLAVAPGGFLFMGGLATFGSGVKEVIGQVTGWHPEYFRR